MLLDFLAAFTLVIFAAIFLAVTPTDHFSRICSEGVPQILGRFKCNVT